MRKIIKYLFLLLIVIYSQNNTYAVDCGSTCHGLFGCWWRTYSSDQQACNRCNDIGGISGTNCSGNIAGHGAAIFNITTINPGGGASYQITYRTCGGYSFLADTSNDDCSSGWTGSIFGNNNSNYSVIPITNPTFITNISECTGANVTTVGQMNVCLMKFGGNSGSNTVNSSSAGGNGFPINFQVNIEDPGVVCAYDGNSQYWIGCTRNPAAAGPPPFPLSILPQIYPVVNDAPNFSGDLFENPIGVVSFNFGTRTVDISPNDTPATSGDPYTSCKKFKNWNFCGSLSYDSSGKISLTNNASILGDYPRPALQQQSNISIIPCYQTYTDEKTGNLYQGIVAYEMNVTPNNNSIGSISNGTKIPIYLGKNYLPSTSPSVNGSVLSAECDLCINAGAVQQYQLSGNSGQSVSINACTLNSDITFSKLDIKLKQTNTDNTTSLVTTPALTSYNDSGILSQKQQCYCTNNPTAAACQANANLPIPTDDVGPCTINYNYTIETGIIDKYKIKIQTITPLLDSNGNLQYTNVNASPQPTAPAPPKNCADYTKPTTGGMPYLTPGGLRNTTFCYSPTQPPQGSNYPVCNASENFSNAICSGIYDGPLTSWQLGNDPDKICLIGVGDWDFITGRSASTAKDVFSKSIAVPGTTCASLPGCGSLLNSSNQAVPIPNIGGAIWNNLGEDNKTILNRIFVDKNGIFSVLFGQNNIKGACQPVDHQTPISNINKYVYQYYMNKYSMITTPDPSVTAITHDVFAKAQTEFKTLITAIKDDTKKKFISESEINIKLFPNLSQLYQAYTSNDKTPFLCQKIIPNAQCIGGIYSLRDTNGSQIIKDANGNITNGSTDTSCVLLDKKDANGNLEIPVKCTETP